MNPSPHPTRVQVSAWPEDVAGPCPPVRRDWKPGALPVTLLDACRAARTDGPRCGHGCSAVISGPEGAGPLHVSGHCGPGSHSRPRGQAERGSEDAEGRPEPGRGPWGCAVPSPTGLSWSREQEPAVEEAPRGGGLSQRPGELLLKVKVKVCRTKPHPTGAKAAGAGRQRGHWAGAPGETGSWPQRAPAEGEGALSTGARVSAGRGLMASHCCRGRGPGDAPLSPPGGPRPCSRAVLSLTSPPAPPSFPGARLQR